MIDPSQRRPPSSSSRASSPGKCVLAAPSQLARSRLADTSTAALASQSFLQNPYYFMFASLAKPDEDVELHWLKVRVLCHIPRVFSLR